VHPTRGLRPPLLVGNASAGRIMRIPAASSTGTSLRPGTRPAHMRIYLRTRYVHQGWRTPSGPGCVCGRCCRCAILADGEDTFFHGWLTPAAPDAQCRFTGESDIRGAQTHVHKSGGREHAVAFLTAYAGAMRRISASRIRMRNALHGGLTPPAPGCMRDTSRAICVSDSQGRMCLGRECEPYANYAHSTCKFDRNIAAFGNAPSTHAYSSADSTTFTTGGLRHPLLVARCRAGAPNAERSERTADIGESRIGASLIGEWICLPPVGLFACCPDSGIRASLIGEWICLPPVGLFACCLDSVIRASLIGEWICLPPVALFAC
jgi:hypothetical protein